MPRAFVLLSGGIDSTTCLHLAYRRHFTVEAVSINYGQRHKKEIEYAIFTCHKLGIPHRTVDLPSVIPTTMLTDPKAEIPKVGYDEILGNNPIYVPFRNGLLLSTIAAIAKNWIDQEYNGSKPEAWIYFGANADWVYPDGSPEWIGAMANAIHIGTYRMVRLVTPIQWMSKAEVIKRGKQLGIDWQLTWSCYEGNEKHCGACPTCRARKAGFAEAGVSDPTSYTN